MRKKWNSVESELVNRLTGQGFGSEEISKKLDGYGFKRSAASVRGWLQRQAGKDDSGESENGIAGVPEASRDPQDPVCFEGVSKALVLSDMHIPFHALDIIEEAIERDGRDADVIVLAGDTLDVLQVSTFGTRSLPTSLEQDADAAIKLIKQLVEIAEVIWIDGNHERRVGRHQAKRTKDALKFMADQVNLALFIESKVDSEKFHYTKPPLSWYCLINNVVVSHPDNYYTPPMKTAVSSFEYFRSRYPGLEGLAQGHSHAAGILYDPFVIETGCMCKIQDYTRQGNTKYVKQIKNAWGVLYFNEYGSLDQHRSGVRLPRGAK